MGVWASVVDLGALGDGGALGLDAEPGHACGVRTGEDVRETRKLPLGGTVLKKAAVGYRVV